MTDTFLADFQLVVTHFNLSKEEREFCWKAYRRSPRRARIAYRAIARSL